MNSFVIYFGIGIILYPFMRKKLDRATDKVLDKEEDYINRDNFKKYIMFPIFIIFWPVYIFKLIKNNIS